MLYRYVLGWRTSLRRLRKQGHGLTTGSLQWGHFLNSRLRTRDGRLQLTPPELVAALRDALRAPPTPTERHPLLLISGARRAASFNSWTHNIPALADKQQGNFATVSEADAERLDIEDGRSVEISTTTGTIRIEARVSADIRPGVVAVQQFWGHVYGNAMTTAASTPGVNVNHLHDDQALDRLCGMPVFNGTPCSVRPV
jgi:anaerobic selenocysteine-containing dehydrogenase